MLEQLVYFYFFKEVKNTSLAWPLSCKLNWMSPMFSNTFSCWMIGILKNYVILVVIKHAFERREIILNHFLTDLCPFFVIFNTMPYNAIFFYVTLYICYEMYVFSNKIYTRIYIILMHDEYLHLFHLVLLLRFMS